MHFKVLLAISIFVSTTAHSIHYMTGNRWVEMNESTKQGYVMGVIDAYMTSSLIREDGMLFITNCIPSNVRSNQMVNIVNKYLLNNPELLHKNLDALVSVSISSAYPCKNNGAL